MDNVKRTILIIEDNAINREILTDILSSRYEVLEAENGQQGLELLEKYKKTLSLVLLDIQMPVLDGYAFLDAIRGNTDYSNIPIIVTTSSASATDEIRCLENGATDFISKPYNPDVVLHRAESIIRFREAKSTMDKVEHDPVTGFRNKDFFYVMVETVMSEQPGRAFDMVCFQVNSYKMIKDRFGQVNLDALVSGITGAMFSVYPSNSSFGRLNSYTFAVFTERQDREIHAQYVEKVRAAVRGTPVPNASISVSLYRSIDPAFPAAVICDNALLAIDGVTYQSGKQMAEYDESLRKKLLRQHIIAGMMEEALEKQQFTVYYQAKYHFAKGQFGGAEALIRWNHPELGFISPGEFIPLFEKNGFITRLDFYVVEQVCCSLQGWIQDGKPVVPISVNLSRVDFEEENLAQMITDVVDKYAVPHALVHLEVTESAYASDIEQFLATVTKLRSNGFSIELDDFGSGYSTLSVLNDMDIDVLKLDMSLVRNMDSYKQRVILSHVLDIAKTLGMEIVAEGVETEEQADELKDMGCTYAQGFFYAKPVPKEQFEDSLRQ